MIMRGLSVVLVVTLSSAASVAAEPPSWLTNADVETRDGAPAAALERAAHDRTSAWIAWSVPALAEARDVCCFSDNFKRRGCSLAGHDDGWGTSDPSPSGAPAEIEVLVETKGGAPSRIKIVSPTCSVDGAARKVDWLGPVESAASLTALQRLIDASGDDLGHTALAAIAYHRDALADAIIEKRVLDRSLPSDEREKAVFWAGEARGQAGYKLIDRVLTQEPDGDLRQHAVFALSQSHVDGAPDRIKRVAVEDRDADVRAHAYFSLSQTQADGTGAWIVDRLDFERNDHVREQAIFALSQLHDGTDWLLRVLRARKDPESVKRALFWLGQSDDPRALEEIEKILDR